MSESDSQGGSVSMACQTTSLQDGASPPSGSIIILAIPFELVQRVLTFCHPYDVAAFSQTCRLAHAVVYCPVDEYLWRELFLYFPFDDPRRSAQHTLKPDSLPVAAEWKHELIRRLNAERLCFSLRAHIDEKKAALETLIHVVHRSTTLGASDMHFSYDLRWVERVLRESRVLDDEDGALAVEAWQSLARLRSYVALSLDTANDERTNQRLKERRNRSRCFVYDLRHYTSDNGWGPYLDGGGVNWVHIESLINVILMNLHELPGSRNHPSPPLGLQATRAYSAPMVCSSKVDWAGIEGTWRRYVSFMDYRDLFAFNYSDIPTGFRNPSFFEDLRFREATRLIEMNFHLIPKQNMRFLRVPEPTALHPRYPPLYFTGSSMGVNGQQATVEGMVQMNLDGIVQWQFAAIYSSNIQWSSEGAQVGNIASAFGVVGVWTTALHDQGDPAGPFWMWKVKDDDPSELMDYN